MPVRPAQPGLLKRMQVGSHLIEYIHNWAVWHRKERKRKVYAGHRPRALRKGNLTSKLARAPPECGTAEATGHNIRCRTAARHLQTMLS
eukprot:1161566-Pelagomonas_calceolata.AAC.8